MQDNSPPLLETWCSWIVQELISHQVVYFCIAPGSRSTPLVCAISNHPQAQSFIHFDERALGFHALGFAKASKKPVAILVTSGTAVGNLLPSIMEAHESCIPLIILTADRPSELQDCGANQTTYQEGIFNHFVRWQQTLPHPDSSFSKSYIQTTIAQAIFKASTDYKGPVHLNCQLREPFFTSSFNPPLENFLSQKPYVTLVPSQKNLYPNNCKELASLINSSKQGIILLGYETFHTQDDLSSFYKLSQKLNWPILADVLSGFGNNPLSIGHCDLFKEILLPDCVLHFGGPFVSKEVLAFLKKSPISHYLHIASSPKRQDPAHLNTHRLQLNPLDFCLQIEPYLEQKPQQPKLQNLHKTIQIETSSFFEKTPQFTEPHIFHLLKDFNFSSYSLFLANSMPIRDASHFFHCDFPPKMIYGNRGLSGIDGNIATAVGIAKAINHPMLAILGDQTFLHDLNSLSQVKCLNHPLIILVFNNHGGAIFTHLPIYEKKELCETYFVASHDLNFESAANLFKLPYKNYISLEAFKEEFSTILHSSKHYLVECTTCKEDNLHTRQELKKYLATHVKHQLLWQ
ncbi:MAG: 2-succinyl-5-enolpyruvyl-6-hydroxy-3-cyclohexene-1-carboxylic-acid synthase [Chlamydiota bacterium]